MQFRQALSLTMRDDCPTQWEQTSEDELMSPSLLRQVANKWRWHRPNLTSEDEWNQPECSVQRRDRADQVCRRHPKSSVRWLVVVQYVDRSIQMLTVFFLESWLHRMNRSSGDCWNGSSNGGMSRGVHRPKNNGRARAEALLARIPVACSSLLSLSFIICKRSDTIVENLTSFQYE